MLKWALLVGGNHLPLFPEAIKLRGGYNRHPATSYLAVAGSDSATPSPAGKMGRGNLMADNNKQQEIIAAIIAAVNAYMQEHGLLRPQNPADRRPGR